MQLDPKRSFERDVRRIKDHKMKQQIKRVLDDLQQAEDLLDSVCDIKAIKGASGYYRVRIGNYRMGVKLVENRLELLHLRHRKNIYQVFP